MSEHAESSTAPRLFWLLGVPIISALAPLVVLAGTDASLGVLTGLVVGAIPLIGGLGAMSYSFVAPVRALPLTPYVVAGALYLFVMLVAANMTADNPMEFGSVKVIGFALPVLALAGGIGSYLWMPEPEPAWEAEPEAEAEAF